MDVYLKAKHWQLFAVLVAFGYLTQDYHLGDLLGGLLPGLVLASLPLMLFLAVLFGWLWSISAASTKRLPEELRSSLIPMQIALVYVLIYPIVFNHASIQNPFPQYIIPAHILAMISMFYVLGFTAKQLIKLERQEKVSFFSYVGTFFQIWFFPFGIWFVQRKVNRLLVD